MFMEEKRERRRIVKIFLRERYFLDEFTEDIATKFLLAAIAARPPSKTHFNGYGVIVTYIRWRPRSRSLPSKVTGPV